MRSLTFGVLLALCLALSGCFDYTENLWLLADGSAKLEVVTAMKDVTAGLGGDGELPFGADKEFEDGSGKVWTERKDGQIITHIDGEIKDFRKSSTLEPAGASGKMKNVKWYTIEPLGFGRYKFTREVSFPGANSPDEGVAAEGSSGADSPLGSNPLSEMGGALGKSLMDQMLAGHEFSVTLHAPLILSSNADVKSGSTTATCKREMTQLMGDGAQGFTIEATVMLLDYKLLAMVGGGVLLLLILLIVIAAKRKRGGKADSGMPSSVDQPGSGI